MTLSIELTADEETTVIESARSEGKDVEHFVRDRILANDNSGSTINSGASTAGSKLLERLRTTAAIGIWKSELDTPEFARALRHRAEERVHA